MAHSHAHSHSEQESTYFLDQLCTIAVGGLLGFTAIGLYSKGWLQSKFLLNDRFHIPVLIAGICLVALVVVRAFAVWRLAGQARSSAPDAHEHTHHNGHDDHDHGHEHSHGHQHSHAHGHERHAHGHEHSHSHEHSHGHEHAHGHEHSHAHHHEHEHGHEHPQGEDAHDHGWAPWQYAILIIPAVLYFLGLPRDGYNQSRLKNELRFQELDAGKMGQRAALANLGGSMVLPTFKKSNEPPVHLRFSELKVHSAREASRDALEGRTVILDGFFEMSPRNDREFQLFRVMTNCCSTDAIVLPALIMAPEPLQGYQNMDWVQIEGELTFQKKTGTDTWVPVILIPTMDKIEKRTPPTDPGKDV